MGSSVAQTPAASNDAEAYSKAIVASLAKAAAVTVAVVPTESSAPVATAPAAPAAPATAPVAVVQKQSKAASKSNESAKDATRDVYEGMADFGATVDNIGEEQVLDNSL
jgi:hypothetical protein